MIKLYKYGFWFLIIVTFTMFNYGRLYKNKAENDIKLIQQINKKRITSLFLSNNVINRQISVLIGENIITKQKENVFTDTTLVILLSDFKCSKCQVRELKRLNLLNINRNLGDVNIIGITTKEKKNQVAAQRKILKLGFPIYWVDNDTFFNKLAFTNDFPQILLVADGILLSAFKPIVMDNEFSENYYKHLIKVLNN